MSNIQGASTSIEEYHISDEDLDPGFCYYEQGCITRAAKNPDSRLLSSLLAHGLEEWNSRNPNPSRAVTEEDRDVYFGPNAAQTAWENGHDDPLLNAILHQLPENINVLLEAGANPNAVLPRRMNFMSAPFLRFAPSAAGQSWDFVSYCSDNASVTREWILEYLEKDQTSPLTRDEIEERFFQTVAPFWSGPWWFSIQNQRNCDSVPAPVAAARGNIAIYDHVVASGADISFWVQADDMLPEAPTPSSLSISSPLHAAIQERNTPMIKHLLDNGYNPNVQPLGDVTRIFSPLASTMTLCNPWNEEAFNILSSHPKIDFNTRTPVYDVHLLHFAAAILSIPLLRKLTTSVSLHNAKSTAVGHTLLHIACLPLDQNYIQRYSSKCWASIHEVRSFSQNPFDIYENLPGDRGYEPLEDLMEFKDYSAPSSDYFGAQLEVVKFLITEGVNDVSATDVHGNTALHYLAGHRRVNHALISLLRTQDGAETDWREKKNRYGFTAQDLFEDGRRAIAIEGKICETFWVDEAKSNAVRELRGKQLDVWRERLDPEEFRIMQELNKEMDDAERLEQ